MSMTEQASGFARVPIGSEHPAPGLTRSVWSDLGTPAQPRLARRSGGPR